jgi:hypothetical protein
MLRRLFARWRDWVEALAGIDDPMGEYLLGLDERIRRLEGQVAQKHGSHLDNVGASRS